MKMTSDSSSAVPSLESLRQQMQQRMERRAEAERSSPLLMVLGRLQDMLLRVEWVRQGSGNKYACAFCGAVCERDGGPDHADDCEWKQETSRDFVTEFLDHERSLVAEIQRLRDRTHELQERHDKERAADAKNRRDADHILLLLKEADDALKADAPDRPCLFDSPWNRALFLRVKQRAEDAEAEIQRLTDALKKYGQHEWDCASVPCHGHSDGTCCTMECPKGDGPCTCGLAQIL